MLVARLRHIAGTRGESRRYLNMNLLIEFKKEELYSGPQKWDSMLRWKKRH